jgi:hypothetical protein
MLWLAGCAWTHPWPTVPPGSYLLSERHTDWEAPIGAPQRPIELAEPAPWTLQLVSPDGRAWASVTLEGEEAWLEVEPAHPRLVELASEERPQHAPRREGWTGRAEPFGDPRWLLVDLAGPWGPRNVILDRQTGEVVRLSGDIEMCRVDRRYDDWMSCSYDLMGSGWVSARGEEQASLLGW